MNNISVLLSSLCLLVLASLLFFFLGEDYYQSKTTLALGADTLTYLDFSESLVIDLADASLVGVSFNFFGPVLLIQIFNSNFFLIFFFNCFIYSLSIFLLTKVFRFNRSVFNFFIWLNPMILFSLLVVNKEILAFASMSFFFVYVKNRKFLILLISILFAVLTRWQMVVFIFVCLLLNSRLNPFRKRRMLSLLIIIFSASLFYGFQSEILYEGFERTSETVDFQADRWFGIIPILNKLQSLGLYFLVVVPKSLFNLIGNPVAFLKIPSLLNPENYKFFYNDFVISLHQLAVMILVLVCYQRSLLTLNNNGFYYSLVYLIIFSLSPIVNTRYIFPIYILLVVELASSYKLPTKEYSK